MPFDDSFLFLFSAQSSFTLKLLVCIFLSFQSKEKSLCLRFFKKSSLSKLTLDERFTVLIMDWKSRGENVVKFKSWMTAAITDPGWNSTRLFYEIITKNGGEVCKWCESGTWVCGKVMLEPGSSLWGGAGRILLHLFCCSQKESLQLLLLWSVPTLCQLCSLCFRLQTRVPGRHRRGFHLCACGYKWHLW